MLIPDLIIQLITVVIGVALYAAIFKILKNIIMPMLYYLPIKLHMIKRVEELGEVEKLV